MFDALCSNVMTFSSHHYIYLIICLYIILFHVVKRIPDYRVVLNGSIYSAQVPLEINPVTV